MACGLDAVCTDVGNTLVVVVSEGIARITWATDNENQQVVGYKVYRTDGLVTLVDAKQPMGGCEQMAQYTGLDGNPGTEYRVDVIGPGSGQVACSHTVEV